MRWLILFVLFPLCMPRVCAAHWTGNYGATLESFRGIPAKSNGDPWHCTGTGTCGDWQCVEYVKRFYADEVKDPITQSWGVAANAYDLGDAGLTRYANGDVFSPVIADILCFDDGGAGHVGIVTEVGGNYVKMIDQNRTNDPAKVIITITLDVVNGRYTVHAFDSNGDYVCEGWLRDPDYTACPMPTLANARSAITTCRNQNTWLGSMTADIHEWHPGDGKWVYITDYQKGSVVFDALGGAKQAYAVDSYMLGCWVAVGGSSGTKLGCPIGNRYAWNGGLRMDWNFGYLFEKTGISCGPIKWGTAGYYGPGTFAGYAIDCQATYKFAACFSRNGVVNLGYPASGNGVQPYVHALTSNPTILAQDFANGKWNDVVLFYDRNASDYAGIVAAYCPSPNTPDQASELHGGLRTHWEMNGRFTNIGVPFTDEVPISGKSYSVYQRFIRKSGSNWVGCELRWATNNTVTKVSLFTKAVSTSSVADIAITPVDDSQESPVLHPQLTLTPNPTFGSSTIRFALHEDTAVQLQVFDIAGRLVQQLLDGTRPAGEHQVQWNGTDMTGRTVANGIYFVRLAIPASISVQRLVVLR